MGIVRGMARGEFPDVSCSNSDDCWKGISKDWMAASESLGLYESGFLDRSVL